MSWRSCLAVGLLLGLVSGESAAQERKPVPAISTWSGKVENAQLLRLAPKSGVIADEQTWQRIATGWSLPRRLPRINFSKQVILVGTAPGPNSVIFRPSIGKAGDVNFTVASTKIAGPGFGYTLMLIDRAGVKTVNGVPLPAPVQTYVRVEIRGELKTGIAAIGGETTGTIITAGPITWELDVSANPALRRQLSGLNGKIVIVKGELEKKRGVEIRERWIVHVKELADE